MIWRNWFEKPLKVRIHQPRWGIQCKTSDLRTFSSIFWNVHKGHLGEVEMQGLFALVNSLVGLNLCWFNRFANEPTQMVQLPLSWLKTMMTHNQVPVRRLRHTGFHLLHIMDPKLNKVGIEMTAVCAMWIMETHRKHSLFLFLGVYIYTHIVRKTMHICKLDIYVYIYMYTDFKYVYIMLVHK